jgi:hypothetical protein
MSRVQIPDEGRATIRISVVCFSPSTQIPYHYFKLWGHAVVQLVEAGRSRVLFPMVSLELFVDIILPAAL